MTWKILHAACAGVAALGACATPPNGEPATPEAAANFCPVFAARDWTAHRNAMPGPDATPTLVVTGEVDMPQAGYTVTLTAGRSDRSAQPWQELVLTAAPPEQGANVITPVPVRYEGPAIAETYAGVRIVCGGQPLAEIDVETVH